ncbi:MAG TPA: CPBP family intramembrane glutamic endopeptidase [Gemmata sp.]
MPIDLSEAVRLVVSGALVAAAAVPAGPLAFALRRRDEPVLPRWKPFPVPWGGFEVTVVFAAVTMIVPIVLLQLLEANGFYQIIYGDEVPRANAEGVSAEQKAEASTIRVLWAYLLSLPLVLGGLALVRAALHPTWRPTWRGSLAGKIALAVLAWCVLAPTVLVLNTVVNIVALQLGVPPDTHSLAKLGGRPLLDQALLVLEACGGAPVREEIVIRGIVLWWCVGRIKLPGLGVAPVTNARPWFVMAAATAYSAVNAYSAAGWKWQPVAFAGALALGLAVLWRVKRTGARRARAVYATAAFFALMHPVWPNPIALFVLGLGLGYLSVRTNGLLVPIAVHALFNAVSVVFVLRGG